ncbi:hypothetical protein HHK36_006000 [Tetracentron sinense]|uniref:Serine aminopeptidase S33 domain-containing protein n=1 Tax=Tetracentron sinense TaxID=13715 RepID=A0A835DNV3_TETSI|nr:hypothetical protein HHK36_006000 [Tetracentron sinense]
MGSWRAVTFLILQLAQMASLASNLFSLFKNLVVIKQPSSRLQGFGSCLPFTRSEFQKNRADGSVMFDPERTRPSSPNHNFEMPLIQQQRIVILNNYGERLVGLLHETGSMELVILCHGFRSSKLRCFYLQEHNSLVNLAAALGKEGISAFRFDFAGNGESEGSFQYGDYHREADDLRAVVLHFHKAERVINAIIGHSKGGNVVLLYASRYHDVHTVVNISGRFDLDRGIEGRLGKDFKQKIKRDGFIDVKNKTGGVEYRVTEESLMDRLTTDTHAACLSIENKCSVYCNVTDTKNRVLSVHGSVDKIVPVEDALEFAKIIPNHELHIIGGADHDYTSHQAELSSVVLGFLRAGLKQDKYMPYQAPSCPRQLIHSKF